MAQSGTGNDDFDRLARQYWSQWGEMMRGAAAQPAQSQVPGWEGAIDWWSKLARGGGGQAGAADDAINRFNSQASGWLGRMQQVASRFAGRDASAADIVDAWKQSLGDSAGNPFAQVMGDMGGRGQHGVEDWMRQAMPFLQGLQRQWQVDGANWSEMPAFGFAREHQERLQRLAQAQRDAQQHSQAFHALMAQAGQDAFKRFERKLAECGQAGEPLDSARALLDRWVDAAEEAYADIALSPGFRDAYAAMVNAQMTLRGRVQGEIEQVGELLGVPTRTEVDAAHRKIVQLEREVRRLRDTLHDAGVGSPAREATPAPRPSSGRKVGKSTAAKKSAKKAVKKKAAANKGAAKKASKKKPASKQAAAKSRSKAATSRSKSASAPGKRRKVGR